MSDAAKADAPPAEAAPSKSKAKLFVIAGAVAVLAGAGGGGYWWWSHRAPADARVEAPVKEEEPADSGIVSFEPFVANLADEGGTRFVRASMKLVVAGAEKAKAVEENAVVRAQLQSAILEELTIHTAEQLVTPDGKASLKKEILERAGKVVRTAKVTDVLFTEFVVQF
jgi:flagellar FliL protein